MTRSSLYARGMTVREIQQHLTEIYGAEVSPTLISMVTDGVMDEGQAMAISVSRCYLSRGLSRLHPCQSP